MTATARIPNTIPASTDLLIAGHRRPAKDERIFPVEDPSNGETIA